METRKVNDEILIEGIVFVLPVSAAYCKHTYTSRVSFWLVDRCSKVAN